jgi:hypothetical protein
MANLGVFDWIREGVRRSVILGVSDAFEQLGTPDDHAELHPQLSSVLGDTATRMLDAPSANGTPRASKTERRRLGRSLDQLRTTAKNIETAPTS